MGQYTKLSVLLLRVFGILIMLYAVPMSLLKLLAGSVLGESAAGGQDPGLAAWFVYAVVGFLTFILARPLGRLAGRHLDD